jgi:hypothetical protein
MRNVGVPPAMDRIHSVNKRLDVSTERLWPLTSLGSNTVLCGSIETPRQIKEDTGYIIQLLTDFGFFKCLNIAIIKKDAVL